ncbi:hypothetical protein [Roseisolibacter sp. H3M3-2]|uniref:hypothetical protein n=1 Tax=Roseisolibacter sp. H3M3-2 TaxID=3031323 RepID=UPI0023DC20D7|nr:hypothetical protein [Roseisolibacter sp. H3M3-2]MDF1503821.1 hypothetical protein [Roseisolibacter sp. H3M3-2]
MPPPGRVDSAARLLALHDALRALFDDAHVLDLREPRVPTPVSARLTLRLGEALEVLVAHQRRHLDQAWRVRRAANFPRVHHAAAR